MGVCLSLYVMERDIRTDDNNQDTEQMLPYMKPVRRLGLYKLHPVSVVDLYKSELRSKKILKRH